MENNASSIEPDYYAERDRLRRRQEYLRINHPSLCDAIRNDWGKSGPSFSAPIINAWINSWVHSDESIEDGLMRLCLHLARETDEMGKSVLDTLRTQKTSMFVPTRG